MFVERCADTIAFLPSVPMGEVDQHDAQRDCGLRNIMVSTDPPYYDNIGYADLSDFFYVWMRQSLIETYPELFSTMLVPKAEELIVTPYRHEGSVEQAKEFFEDGMLSACKQMYLYAREDIPVTIYYAYKQSDADADGTASSGWETMLSAVVNAGFTITGTWPVRTESPGRAIAQSTNALASSIVLVCRKRPADAPQTTRRNLINALRRELRPALQKLQASNIAPVDLAQSAIGPGMGVFSRFQRVLEADGTPMSVRSALKIINEEIDLYFNEQVGDMDSASRFCVDLYTQNAFNDIKYGEAEILATAKSTSIPMMASHGMVYAKAGIVHLMDRTELPERVDPSEQCIWMLTQQLTQAMAKGGIEACAQILADMFGSNGERAKDLAYLNMRGSSPRVYRNMLAFVAPDQDKLRDLKTEVKRFIAWKSIISDKEDLNLDGGQLREAESSLSRSNNSVESRIKETYCWLLVPFIDQYEDIKTIQWEISNLGGGDDEIVSKAAKKMVQGEQIIATWAPALLKMSLDELLWKDSNDIAIKKLWEFLCTYCYLPRLANYSVLEDAITRGARSTEFFGVAAGYSGERYIDLRLNEIVYPINQSDLLVKPAVAMKQIMEEGKSGGQDGNGISGSTGSTGGSGSGIAGGQQAGGVSGQIGDDSGTGAAPKNTRFFMSAKLDNTRVNKNVNDYLTEVIQHLMSVDGADVELTLEVSVNAPGGIPSATVRTVSENCRTLKIQDFGFEDN